MNKIYSAKLWPETILVSTNWIAHDFPDFIVVRQPELRMHIECVRWRQNGSNNSSNSMWCEWVLRVSSVCAYWCFNIVYIFLFSILVSVCCSRPFQWQISTACEWIWLAISAVDHFFRCHFEWIFECSHIHWYRASCTVGHKRNKKR